VAIALALDRALFGSKGDPLTYPGELPSRPYLVEAERAHELGRDATGRLALRDDGQPVDLALRARGSAPMAERIPQIAYGANRDLVNISWKMRAYGQSGEAGSAVVLIPARLPNADVVACNLGYWGYLYGSVLLHAPPILDRPYLAGTSVEVALLFLDPAQLAAMHKSEGVPQTIATPRDAVSCDVALTRCFISDTGEEVEAQLYVLPLPYLSLDGGKTPTPFANVTSRHGRLNRWSQDEMWAAVADRLDLGDPAVVVATLHEAALQSRLGEGRVSDRTLDLYDMIRERIAMKLAFRDTDGIVRSGVDGCPGLLSYDQAWSDVRRSGANR